MASKSEQSRIVDTPERDRGLSVTHCGEKIKTELDVQRYCEAHSQNLPKILGYCYLKRSVIERTAGLANLTFNPNPIEDTVELRTDTIDWRLNELHFLICSKSADNNYPTENEAELLAIHARNNLPWHPAEIKPKFVN